MDQLHDLVTGLNEHAKTLAKSFWPGPLTLVTNRSNRVPDIVSGGLDTVAVRFPASRIARALINTSGVPIAAPSANVSGKPSSTRAEHVAADLCGKIDMIIDGGASVLGLESTIVDVSGDTPCLLRPGTITLADIESLIGEISIDSAVISQALPGVSPKAPGMAYKHYAPNAELTIVPGGPALACQRIIELIGTLHSTGADTPIKAAVITTDENFGYYRHTQAKLFSLGKRANPPEIAANLYDILRALDVSGITHAFTESFEESGIGLSIMNRLRKAAVK